MVSHLYSRGQLITDLWCDEYVLWQGRKRTTAKKAGRGVFLKKFPHIMAMDVATFSQYYVYLAAPLFSEAERNYNLSIAGLLRKNFFDVFLPQETAMIQKQEPKKNRYGSLQII